MSVQSRSDGVNTSLFEKREHIEKLHRTRNLLRKVQVWCIIFQLHHFFFVLFLFMLKLKNPFILYWNFTFYFVCDHTM